jgi:hypothetical protein
VGYLQPNVIDSVHDIADHYLDKGDPDSDEAFFREAIANTTSSVVASNAGNQVSTQGASFKFTERTAQFHLANQ